MTEGNRRANLAHLFHLHFVRAGLVPSRIGKLLSGLQKYREQADYERAVGFNEEGAREELAHAEEICAFVRARLVAEGWIEPPTAA